MIRVVHETRVECNSQVHRTICRCVAGVIAVGHTRFPAGHVAELIGAISVAELEHGACGKIADSGRCSWVQGRVVGVKAEVSHQRIENARFVAREDVDRSAVGRKTDRGLLVRPRVLAVGAAELRPETSSNGVAVERSPGVVSAGMDDR